MKAHRAEVVTPCPQPYSVRAQALNLGHLTAKLSLDIYLRK